jgi:NADH:ubiquinone oxidoreductase subunit B-like Fe-S oxidoreductase
VRLRCAPDARLPALPGPGGLFAGSDAVVGGVSAVIPVDLHIRGCPPTPVDLLRGLLALLEPATTGDRV